MNKYNDLLCYKQWKYHDESVPSNYFSATAELSIVCDKEFISLNTNIKKI